MRERIYPLTRHKLLPIGLIAFLLLVLAAATPARAVEGNAIGPASFNSSGVDVFAIGRLNERRIVEDSSGRLHTVYYRTTGTGTEIIYARSDDNGATWPPALQTTIATNAVNQEVLHPAIAILNAVPNPSVFIVYNRHNLPPSPVTSTQIFIRNGVVLAGSTVFGAETNISTQLPAYTIPTGGLPTVYDNNLFVDAAGIIHLAWVNEPAGNPIINYTFSINGATWTNTVSAFDPIGGSNSDRAPYMSQDPLGNLYLMWDSAQTAGLQNYQIAYRIRTAGVWGAQNLLNFGTQALWYPAIEFDTNGNSHLIYGNEVVAGTTFRIEYRENFVSPIIVSATNQEFAANLGMTTRNIPVVVYRNFSTNTIFLSSKTSNGTFSAPQTISPVGNRSHSNIIPSIQNDRTQTLWFRQDDFTTRHGFQPDIINPYKPDDFTLPFYNLGAAAAWLDQGVCSGSTQRVQVSITALPPDATQVRYILGGLTPSASAFTTATTTTFFNVADNQTAMVSVQSRDAAGNVSLFSTSLNVIIGDRTTGCFPLTINRPPVPVCAGGAIGNFLSVDWTDNNAAPAGGLVSIFYDSDNNCANGVLNTSGAAVTFANALANIPANAATFNIPVANLTNSAMIDTSLLGNGNYFICGVITSAIATVNASSVAPAFTKSNALNGIPQIVVMSANQTPLTTITTTFQYADTGPPGAFSPLNVQLFFDTDNIFGNGAVVATFNPVAGMNFISGAPNAGISQNVFDFGNVPSGTYYVGGLITDGACSSFDYFGTINLVNPLLNSFGAQIYNFPNPFSPLTNFFPAQTPFTTRVVINVPAAHPIDFYIFDTHGKMVWRTQLPATTAYPNFVFYGRDINGQVLPDGVYIMKAVLTDTNEVLKGRMSILDK